MSIPPTLFTRLLVIALLALLIAACTARTAPQEASLADGATEEAQPADAQADTVPASTVQAVLEAAVQVLQGTPITETVDSAGGVMPTATPPLLSEGPAIQIAPAAGPANTQITVVGSGFPANNGVDIYLVGLVGASSGAERPRSYASAVTDRDGNFRVTFAMPATWPSGELIQPGMVALLAATRDFSARADATFEYRVTVATPSPVPTLTPTPLPTATPVASPTATPTLARNPFVEVTPRSGSGGAQLTLRGGGFPANTTVNVHLGTFDAQVGGGTPARYGATRTDGSGNFILSFTLPTIWPDGTAVDAGLLLILVATENFSHQASAVFDNLVPTPTPAGNPYAVAEPSSGSAGTQVTISGGGFPPNTRVDLYLAGLVGVAAAGAQPTSYANAITDNAGNFRLGFVLPATWPDGEPLTSGTLALLVATQDFSRRANATFDYVAPTPTAVSTPGPWRGSYYNNPDLRDDPVLVRDEAEVRFFWGLGSPDLLVPSDNFSASWQRTATFVDGLYRFTVEVDDGVRLFINDQLIIESWRRGERRILSLDFPMRAGEATIRLDYFEYTGAALVALTWGQVGSYAPAPTATPGGPNTGVLFSDNPRNNQRRVNNYFCSGFESECNFAGCARNYRLVWGPYCREGDYPYIQPGHYRVTLYGSGRVRAGATDYGLTQQLFSLGQQEVDLPGSYTFCWPGRQNGGYGFETIVQSLGTYAAVDWITVEYLGDQCR